MSVGAQSGVLPDSSHTADTHTVVLSDYLLSVMRGRPGLVPGVLRLAMCALALVYCAGLKTYLLPYRLGVRKRKRLPCPVISIGNLTTGGTGKTPLTQRLGRLLQERGQRVVVLSRGYGGRHEHDSVLVSDGQRVLIDAGDAGDEAYLLARALPGIPVIAGKDRRVTGRLAWERFRPDLILLDDGMQFWQLHRDLDIVLLNACQPFDNGWTFPRGLLREPPSHLRRAGVVILTNIQRAGTEQTAALQATLSRLAPGRPVLTADLIPDGLHSLNEKRAYPVEWLTGRRIAALSAIGNPASFESLLERMGGIPVAAFRFPDHQALTQASLESIFSHARQAGAEAVVITEKDAVKLPAALNPAPLLVLQVRLEGEYEAELLARIERILEDPASAPRG